MNFLITDSRFRDKEFGKLVGSVMIHLYPKFSFGSDSCLHRQIHYKTTIRDICNPEVNDALKDANSWDNLRFTTNPTQPPTRIYRDWLRNPPPTLDSSYVTDALGGNNVERENDNCYSSYKNVGVEIQFYPSVIYDEGKTLSQAPKFRLAFTDTTSAGGKQFAFEMNRVHLN